MTTQIIIEKSSFNVGPTLLSWLDRHAPEEGTDRVLGFAFAGEPETS